MNRQRFLMPALLLLTAVRLAALPLRELSPIESYAALCGSHSDLWHAMLGPFLPVLMDITTFIFGNNEFGVRVLAPFLVLGTSWMLWSVGRGFFDSQTASWAVLFFNLLPSVNLAAITMTPMTLGICLSGALLFTVRLALHRSSPWHLFWWLACAVFCLCFFTTWWLFTAAIAAGSALAITSRGRRALVKWPVLPIILGTLGTTATLLIAWDSEHRWIALRSYPATTIPGIDQVWHMILLHSLPAMGAAVWALLHSASRPPLTYPSAFLLSFAWPFFTLDLITFPSNIWPQWGLAGWTAPVVLLLAHHLRNWQPASLRWKAILRSSILLGAGAQSLVIVDTDLVRQSGAAWKFTREDSSHGPWIPPDPSQNMIGWRDTVHGLEATLQDQSAGGTTPALVVSRWDLASPLSFYLKKDRLPAIIPDAPPVLLGSRPGEITPFSPWPGWEEIAGKHTPILFIGDTADEDKPPETITRVYPNYRLAGYFQVQHEGRLVRTVKVFACSP